jgi:tRNA (guanosine-2'-O-)-methyltransferase
VQSRTNHFTIAVEDIFQMHNTSAVMRRGFGIKLNVIEQRYGKVSIKQWVLKMG